MNKYLVVSADCHAGVAWEMYRPYVEAKYQPEFEQWLAERLAQETESQRWRNAFFAPDYQGRWNRRAEDLLGRPTNLGWDTGVWSADERIRALEGDGVVAEVMYPDGRRNSPPFGGGAFPAPLQAHGQRIYNRWLAEFCSNRPEQYLGIAALPVYEIEQAVDDVKSAYKAGLRGINLPCNLGNLPLYHDARYEPLWNTCEELDFPVHFHIGGVPGARSKFQTAGFPESGWYNHRPLWQLIAGGVFERHPKLRVAFVEQGIDWIPDTLAEMDRLFEDHADFRAGLSLKPSEYWARNCWAGHSSKQARWQWELRHEIGVDRLMWGNDFPHPEGLWPFTKDWLKQCLSGVPERELRMLLGENAARFYKLDLQKLAPIVERVGPAVDEV